MTDERKKDEQELAALAAAHNQAVMTAALRCADAALEYYNSKGQKVIDENWNRLWLAIEAYEQALEQGANDGK